jgi:hypothetical protein
MHASRSNSLAVFPDRTQSGSSRKSSTPFAVLIDATIVRIVLVPATMVLLGDANWWLPAWLDRILPKMQLEVADRPDISGELVAVGERPPMEDGGV